MADVFWILDDTTNMRSHPPEWELSNADGIYAHLPHTRGCFLDLPPGNVSNPPGILGRVIHGAGGSATFWRLGRSLVTGSAARHFQLLILGEM